MKGRLRSAFFNKEAMAKKTTTKRTTKKTAAKKETATAKHSKKETAEAHDTRKPAKKPEGVLLKITGGVAYLGWPYRKGQTVVVTDEKQAEEAVSAGRAEYVD